MRAEALFKSVVGCEALTIVINPQTIPMNIVACLAYLDECTGLQWKWGAPVFICRMFDKSSEVIYTAKVAKCCLEVFLGCDVMVSIRYERRQNL